MAVAGSRTDVFQPEVHHRIEAGEPYFHDLRERWSAALRVARTAVWRATDGTGQCPCAPHGGRRVPNRRVPAGGPSPDRGGGALFPRFEGALVGGAPGRAHSGLARYRRHGSVPLCPSWRSPGPEPTCSSRRSITGSRRGSLISTI